MPSYDYTCPSNGRTIEVNHLMSERLTTWGEVCERAGIEPGNTARNAPVERLLGTGYVMNKPQSAGQSPPMHGCGPGCGCGPRM